MTRTRYNAFHSALILFGAAAPAAIGESYPKVLEPRVALHLSSPTTKTETICTSETPNASGVPCSAYTVQGALNQNYLIYLVVAQVDSVSFGGGITGLKCGLEYDSTPGSGLTASAWFLCGSGTETLSAGPQGDWPASGGGNEISWPSCQGTKIDGEGIHSVAGAFSVYAYANSVFRVTPNRNLAGGSSLILTDCAGSLAQIDTTQAIFGRVGFGEGLGFAPCLPVPVAAATWGRIKRMYRN